MKLSLFKSLLSIFSLSILFSCSGDDHEVSLSDFIMTPNTKTANRLTSVSRSGYFENAYSWNFVYDRKNLKSATSVLENGISGEESPMLKYSLSYGSREVKVSTSGEPVVLRVGGDGLLVSATSGNTTFNYSFSDGRLIAWNSLYQIHGFNGQVTKGEDAVFTWHDGNLTKIIYTPSTDAGNKYFIFEIGYYDNELNSNGLLPELVSEAMGCKGAEYLYYAGMLGKPTTNLVKSIKISHSTDESENASYTFHYETNMNDVTLCNYQKDNEPGGRPVIVTYGYK